MNKLTPALKGELENTLPEFQDKLAELLNFSSSMGAYGGEYGVLAVISPHTGEVLKRENETKIS